MLSFDTTDDARKPFSRIKTENLFNGRGAELSSLVREDTLILSLFGLWGVTK